MAKGMGEAPERSPAGILEMVEYPTTPERLAEVAMEAGSPPEVINFLRALPGAEYASRDDVLRDFAEAGSRFGMGNRPEGGAHRSDIGHEMNEPPGGPTSHP